MSVSEISKLSGVSIATVSRVLNRNPQVSPASVAAVQQAAARIGYTPQQRYRRRPRPGALGIGPRSGNIALLFPDSWDYAMRTPLSGRFMHGVTEALMPKHLNMLCTPLQASGDLPLCISQRQVDGVIVRGAVPVAHLESKLKDLPVVWLLETPEIPSIGDQVLEDTSAIGQMAAKYLLDRGGRNFVVVNHLPDHPCYQRRTDAFASAARRAGADVQVLLNDTPIKLADRILDLSPRPAGLFVPFADQETMLLYRRLLERGVRPGADIDWVGTCYDTQSLSALYPMLANIDIRAEALAQAAAEMLLWRLRHPGDPQRRLMISPTLVQGAAKLPGM
jgi:LacI family repressor for deo operon, udp, cdd, tsx, nupC, and nupG